jgi:Family of unknown function (DUF5343)
MAEFPYTTVPGKLKPLFKKMREVGVPQKATFQWLKSIGFTSSNDATLLGVLKCRRRRGQEELQAGHAEAQGHRRQVCT